MHGPFWPVRAARNGLEETMTETITAVRWRLLDMIEDPDAAYAMPAADLAPLQLKAAQELFAVRRKQIPLLAKRAEDAGIREIGSLDDLVPLLFAHTVYKSYPPSFVEQRRWDRMLQWLKTLSVEDTSGVDVSGVKDVDDWIERLWDAGHMVLATSGSSGKVSFLNHTRGDQRIKTRHFKYSVGWPLVRAEKNRPLFWLGPFKGPNSAIESAHIAAENWGRPGAIYWLGDEPLRIADVSRMAAMRKRMTDGTATPGEIAAFEAEAAVKATTAQAQLIELADKILELRHQPMLLTGMWAQHMAIIRRARERGIPDGDFHPQTIVNAGGGVKGVALPPDYKEQVDRFYGKVIRPGAYGMTEMAQLLPRCDAGRYHRAPGQVMLVLNREGDRLLGPEDAVNQQAEGRFAFLDLAYEGRWGGTITGDKVTIDFSPRCPCGRPGPALLDNISRFAQAGEEDHIGCAGTIDSYIRGSVAA
jgi:hypothetical protein